MIKYTKTISGFEPYVFQEDSINKVLTFIDQCNGACIFDQTGLGKTIISTTVALNSDVKRLLVVTTSALKKEWTDILNLTDMEYEICTHKKIPQNNFDFVIVDEAHNFREQTSKGYLELFTVIKQNFSKVLLLTATPFQNNLNQLKTMLSLISFHANSLPFLTLGVTFDKMEGHVKKMVSAEIKMSHQTFGNPTEYNKACRELTDRLRFLSGVVGTFSTRMTRKKIVEQFPDSLDLIGNFPEIIYTSRNYEIDFYGAFSHTCDVLSKMDFARQNIEWYKPENQNKNNKSSMRGLMRSLLLKRLDSSVYAFKQTIQMMYNSILELDKFTGLETFMYEGAEVKVFPIFWENLVSDKKEFEKLIELWKDHNDNVKLDLLFNQLEQSDTKVVVFTEYVDTLNLIQSEAQKRGLQKFITFSGESSEKDLEKINMNFNANQESVLNTIQYLFATDKLAEGVNLHAAKKLIHFDQKWNPSKIVQRNGRVDRILKRGISTSVEIVTFEVSKLIEEILELEKTIDKKIFLSESFLQNLTPLDIKFLEGFENGQQYVFKNSKHKNELSEVYLIETTVGHIVYMDKFNGDDSFHLPEPNCEKVMIKHVDRENKVKVQYPIRRAYVYSNQEYNVNIELANSLYCKVYDIIKGNFMKDFEKKQAPYDYLVDGLTSPMAAVQRAGYDYICNLAPRHEKLASGCSIHFNEPRYMFMVEVGQNK